MLIFEPDTGAISLVKMTLQHGDIMITNQCIINKCHEHHFKTKGVSR